jgi:hypothetical protein
VDIASRRDLVSANKSNALSRLQGDDGPNRWNDCHPDGNSDAVSNDDDKSYYGFSASSSDDEELLAFLTSANASSPSIKDATSCCSFHEVESDCSVSDDRGSDNDYADNDGAESDVLDGVLDDEQDDDEGFISFKFDDYPESVYEGVGGSPELYADEYCLCVRLRGNLNESVKSR